MDIEPADGRLGSCWKTKMLEDGEMLEDSQMLEALEMLEDLEM